VGERHEEGIEQVLVCQQSVVNEKKLRVVVGGHVEGIDGRPPPHCDQRQIMKEVTMKAS